MFIPQQIPNDQEPNLFIMRFLNTLQEMGKCFRQMSTAVNEQKPIQMIYSRTPDKMSLNGSNDSTGKPYCGIPSTKAQKSQNIWKHQLHIFGTKCMRMINTITNAFVST